MNLAIVGATGLVGRTFLAVLLEREVKIDNLYLFASAKSKGMLVTFRGKDYIIDELTEDSFKLNKIDYALFSAGGDISKKFAPIAAENGCIVIDNSSTWRMDETVPLVVPEVNPEDVKWHKGIIANPNCSTIQAVITLSPLHSKYKIKRIIYSTYQAVSGAGNEGIRDLERGMNGFESQKFSHQIYNNCIPQIDVFLDNGYTKEEMKMINETKKILHDDDIKITSTAVRVPVFYSHSENINLEFYNNFETSDIKNLLKNSKGIVVVDDIKNNQYPLAQKATGTDKVYVGRIRRDESVENGLNLWVVADNIRKGAATNAVQILELMLNNQ
ncbi:MAG: aspartate-semialdehyde dehydrogenase [Clostridiales bacterium GWE2_32_10]|nr:MAG: aspartate-semialdehyde dehydrogenase [Clostridiales bacterium GWE2_32_10]HBY21626.1 aspartate-semialdehyde dehydrogenase [Clostridiales bacterium]